MWLRRHPVVEIRVRNVGLVFWKKTGLVARSIFGIVLGIFFAMQTPVGLAQTTSPIPVIGAENEIAKAFFDHLDCLAEQLSERRNLATQVRECATIPPDPVLTLRTSSNGDQRSALSSLGAEPSAIDHCDSLEEVSKAIEETKGRYMKYGDVIIKVNKNLPGFRKHLLDPKHICLSEFEKLVASGIQQLEEIDIRGDQQYVYGHGVCMDRLRREIDAKMSQDTNTIIRQQRLAAQQDRLRGINEQIINLDLSLLRGISKRDRLIQELKSFHEEIKEACKQ